MSSKIYEGLLTFSCCMVSILVGYGLTKLTDERFTEEPVMVLITYIACLVSMSILTIECTLRNRTYSNEKPKELRPLSVSSIDNLYLRRLMLIIWYCPLVLLGYVIYTLGFLRSALEIILLTPVRVFKNGKQYWWDKREY